MRILCGERVGTGAPITPRLVLTCEHVVRGHRRATVRSATGELLAFEVVDADADLDVALLRASTTPLPAAASLTLRALWRGAPLLGGRAVLASCTAEPDTLRSIDVELRPAPPASRRVQFGVLAARDGVRPGYSGAPVVELDMRSSTPRAVGLVRARDRDSLDVLDRAGAGWLVPTERIAERFAEVACLVETPVQRDAAWESHWEPRSRGVAASTEPGFFFTGRKAAYERVREHLDADAGGLLVVTGQRGHGKSSLLARAVALATARYVATLGPHAAHALAGDTPPIRLDAATVARGRSVATVADELALQLGVLADGAQQLVAACERDRLAPRIVIDAVDESIDPGALMRELVVGLAGAGASIAIGAVAGRVRLDAPQGTGWLDLDDPRYGDDAIPQYVERRLLATGRYEVATARILSRAVARRARANFLVAELVARSLVHRPMPLDTRSPHWVDALPGDVTDAFRDYLARFGDQRERVLALLHPLAHARGDGLTLDPPDAWLAAANALRPDTMAPFEHADLRRACGLASDYLISSSDGGARRLYHEGLASAIRGLSAQTRAAHPSRPSTAAAITSRRLADARSFVDALCGLLPADRAAAAEAYRGLDPYLLRHLPTHLGEHGRVEELLDRPGLLLCAEQAALRGALVRGALAVPAAREQIRAGLVHALARPQADAARRAAAACAAMRRQHERETERRLRLAWSTRIGVLAGRAAASDPESAARVGAATALPYESISAPRLALTVCTIPNADPAYYAGIGAVAAIEHEGEPLILSAGSAGLRSWRLDGAPGELAQPGHHHAVALAWHDGEPLVIAALGATPAEPTLCGWRLDGTAATGTADGTITTARDIGKLAALALDGEPLVVTASGSTIRSWRLDGSPGGLPVLQSPSKFVTGLSMTSHDGRPLVVCGGDDGAIRSWYVDGAPGPLHGEHGAWIQALVTLEHEGSPLVVAGGIGGALRSWRVDGAPGPLALQLDVRGIRALAVGTVDGDPIVITAGGDGHLLSWYPDGSPGPFAHIDHHEGTAETLAVYDDPEDPLLISVDHDASISAWRLSGAPATREREDARAYQLETSVALRPELSPELASHIAWRLGRARRADIAPDAAHGYRLMAIAVTEHDGRPLVVSAGSDDVGSHVTIGSWRLDGSPGPLDRVFRPSWMQDCRRIAELSIVEHDGEPLVIGCGDAGLQSWRLDGRPGPLSRRGVHPELNSYTKQYDDSIAALAVVREGGAPLVVTGGSDAAIRSWRLDGTPGPLERLHADTHWIGSLAVVWHASLPLIVSGGNDGTLCSWILDGCAGPFVRERAHDGAIRHLAVAEHERQPLVISSSDDAPIRSWRLDGRSGPLTVEQRVSAIAVLEHPVDPWLITGGHDGAIRSWRLDGTPAPFTSEGAHVGGVTKLLVVRHDGRLLVISAGHDLAIVAHRLDAR